MKELLSQYNIGQILLLGFWGVCVMLFAGSVVYMVYSMVMFYMKDIYHRVVNR